MSGSRSKQTAPPNRLQQRSKKSTSCFSTKCFSFTFIIAIGLAIVTRLALQRVELTIHSCHIYAPSSLEAVEGIVSALNRYVEVEGFSSLVGVFGQFVKSEILNIPPYYSADEVQGKKLLMIGGGYIPEFLKHAKILGVEIHLMDDPKMFERTKGLVTSFIPVENFGKISITQKQVILQRVQDLGIKFDGVFTLVEDEGPLVSFLANKLSLVASSEEAAVAARNKYKVRELMKAKGLKTPKFALVEKEEDLEKGANSIGYPVFLKPVFGVAASFAAKAKNLEELKNLYRTFQKEMDPNERTIYNYGNEMILEEMLDGPEIQLELMLHNGTVVFHCFSSEYSPKRHWLVFPVNLTESQKEEMLTLASNTVHAIGLTDGVVHIEMFYSSKGAQVIEVNNRLSRGFLPRRFSHQLMFGDKLTDYFASVVYLALGLKPPAIKREIPPISIAIFLDEPSLTGWETEGGCAIFFGPSPQKSLSDGLSWFYSK